MTAALLPLRAGRPARAHREGAGVGRRRGDRRSRGRGGARSEGGGARRARRAGCASARSRVVVRINGVGTPWFDDDLRAVRRRRRCGGDAAQGRARASDLAAVATRTAPLLPLIETAAGFDALREIARRRTCSAWCSAHRLPARPRHRRRRRGAAAVPLAAGAGVAPGRLAPPVDGVCTRDRRQRAAARRRAARAAPRLRRQAVHPSEAGDAVNARSARAPTSWHGRGACSTPPQRRAAPPWRSTARWSTAR